MGRAIRSPPQLRAAPEVRAAFTQCSARPLYGLSGRLGVIAKFCIYNVLAHAYTIKDFSAMW